jgi:hypothetical protein
MRRRLRRLARRATTCDNVQWQADEIKHSVCWLFWLGKGEAIGDGIQDGKN